MGTHPFTAGQLHAQAFEILKKRFWWCAAVSALVYLAANLVSSLAGSLSTLVALPLQIAAPLLTALGEESPWVILGLIPIFIFCYALCMGVAIVASSSASAVEFASITPMFDIIDGQQPELRRTADDLRKSWKRLLGAAAWVTLWTFLWFMVFFIPGCVKIYQYALTPYLVLEYPKLPVRQAMKLSMRLTKGYKGRLFVTDLIITAWSLLCVLLVCTFIAPMAGTLLFLQPMTRLMHGLAYRNIMEYAREHDLLYDMQEYL